MSRLRPTGGRGRILVAGGVAVVSLALAVVLALVGRTGGAGDGAEADGDSPATTAPPAESSIDIPAPDGWTAAPIPELGFGIAVPPRWEAAVLSPDTLAALPRSSPAVSGFIDAAFAAADGGAVFYAASEDDEGRVSDLKVRAATQSGVGDLAGLESYAEELAADAALASPAVEVVEDADRPTARSRFELEATSQEGETIATQATETVVLGPNGIVWSLIVTSEDPAGHDQLAARITDTLTLVDR